LSTRGSLQQEILISIAPDDPVKFICVKLTNRDTDERQLSIAYYAECVLGVVREQTQMHLISEWNAELGALLIQNPYHPCFSEQLAFLKIIGPNCSATADRVEFFGRNQNWHRPAAFKRESLSGTTGAGYDPCAAVQSQFTLGGSSSIEI